MPVRPARRGVAAPVGRARWSRSEVARLAVRGVAAGLAATAAMTATYELERRLRRSTWGLRPLDYDDGVVPGQIVLHVLHLPDLGSAEETAAGLALRWTYGSAFGLVHVLLRRELAEPAATVMFGSVLLGATLSMFPLLGRTPPPWQWPWQVMATCLVTHAVYVGAGALVDDRVAAISASRPG